MTTVHHAIRFIRPRKSAERRRIGGRLRRLALSAFFVSVAVNAALGIIAVLAPDFGEAQGQILGTSLCVTGAALLALACEPAWERRLLGPVPYAGAALGAIGLGLAIVGIWAEPQSELFGRVIASILIVAGGASAASLIALARLGPHHRWVLDATLALLAIGAGLAATMPWLGDDPSEWYLRALGVILIALAAFAVSVPVLHWVDRASLAVEDTARGELRRCPYCGSAIAGIAGAAVSCERCGRAFTVTRLEPRPRT